jgi:hypothetical protein
LQANFASVLLFQIIANFESILQIAIDLCTLHTFQSSKLKEEGGGMKKKQSQAERVIAKFGGARRLYAALKEIDPVNCRTPSIIYRWTYPRQKGGTGGVIPTAAWTGILKAARIEGIFLTEDDFFPGER